MVKLRQDQKTVTSDPAITDLEAAHPMPISSPTAEERRHVEHERMVLSRLIVINGDACDFYREAGMRGRGIPSVEEVFSRLEKLHAIVVENLGQRLSRICEAADVHLAAKEDGIFAPLSADIADIDFDGFAPENSRAFIDRLHDAEKACIKCFEEVIAEDILSIDSQTFLAEQIGILSMGEEDIRKLGVYIKTLH